MVLTVAVLHIGLHHITPLIIFPAKCFILHVYVKTDDITLFPHFPINKIIPSESQNKTAFQMFLDEI